ncbi:MAG: hypothetical protein ACRDZ6_05775 [Acidimicrobiales bacterium]
MADSGDPTAQVNELVGLVKTYLLQETVGPLKKLAFTVAFGSAAAVLIGIGAIFFLVALLRVLQTETGTIFAGEWSWAPYGLTIIAGVIALSLSAVLLLSGRGRRSR